MSPDTKKAAHELDRGDRRVGLRARLVAVRPARADRRIALPSKAMRVNHRADTPGMMVVKCDVHGWMQSFVRIDAHPFHAVTDAAGSFRIAAVPSGDFVLHAWHEKLGDRRETVRIRAGEVTTLMIEYPSESK